MLSDVRVLPPRGLNTSIYLGLNRFSQRTAWAHGFMHDYALWLGPVLLTMVFVAVYAIAWWRRAPRAAALLVLGGIGTLVSLALNQLVGHAARELRPYATYPHALTLVGRTNDYSFPSDHSVVAGGLTISLLLVLGRALWGRRPASAGSGVPGAVIALTVANVVLGLFLCFARVYVGAHYPGDVVGGYLLATVVVLGFSLLRHPAYRLVEMLDPNPLGVLLRRPGGLAPAPAAVPAGEHTTHAPSSEALR